MEWYPAHEWLAAPGIEHWGMPTADMWVQGTYMLASAAVVAPDINILALGTVAELEIE